jgi:SAM-dependent methyltransferase
MDLVAPQSVVDVGCGTGTWLAEFSRMGVRDLVGLEGSAIDPDIADFDPSQIRLCDLSKPFSLHRKFDLAVCLEVAEHLPEDSAAVFVESLVRLAPIILFSAAVPGQGGIGHLNEQWPEYWADLFSRFGFEVRDCLRDRLWRNREVEWWYRQNLLFFLRKECSGSYPRLDQATNLGALPFHQALNRKMPVALREREEAPLIGDRRRPVSVTVGVPSAGGPKKLTTCLKSIVASGFADEIVVCLDKQAPEGSREAALAFTNRIYNIESQGFPESVQPLLAAHCPGEYLLRIDDDECLSGNWTRGAFDGLTRINNITHFLLCRRWIVPPGDMFLSNSPWFPDFQVRLFKNDPRIITWPKTLHEPMYIAGNAIVLADRWIDHWDLVCNSRPEREKKCESYRLLRPKHHLSDFYLYEEGQMQMMRADSEGFLAAILGCDHVLSQPDRNFYTWGQIIDFRSGGNSQQFVGRGWSIQEPWGRWTDAEAADICFPLLTPVDSGAILTLRANAFLVSGVRPTMRVEVSYNGTLIAVWVFDQPVSKEYSALVPKELISGQCNLTFTFRIFHPASPCGLGHSSDERLLGLGVETLRLDRDDLPDVAQPNLLKGVLSLDMIGT